MNFTLGLISLGLLFFFVLRPIFLFGGFALNKLSGKEFVERKFRVIHTDINYLELKNLESGKVDRVEQIIQENENYTINQDDTLHIFFKKGLFGFVFDPSHKGNSVYPE